MKKSFSILSILSILLPIALMIALIVDFEGTISFTTNAFLQTWNFITRKLVSQF